MSDERAGARQGGGRRFSSRRITAVAVTGLVLASAAALPMAGASTTKSAIAASSKKLTYTKQTVLVPTPTVKSQLMKVSANGATYTFKSKHGVLGKLKKGSVMLLEDVAVRDVTKTATAHKHFVVTTTPAAITDLVSNGTISLAHSINFAKGFGVGGSAVPAMRRAHIRSAQSSVLSKFGLVPLAANKGITFKGKTHSYKYSVNYKPSGSSVAVTITISMDKPIDLEAKITGTLDGLSTAGDIAVDRGSVENAKLLANHLKGNFKLSYTAKPATALGFPSNNPLVITLPAEIAVPFAVGPVPFFLGIGVSFTAHAGFSNLHQELSGSYTFKYDGEGGFSMDQSGATTAEGVIKGVGDIILSAANALKTGPISFIFGAQMPEIELGLGVKGLNVAGKITLLGSAGIEDKGACDTREFEIQGYTGAEANFFGFSADLAGATLFDKTIYAAYPGRCGKFGT